MKNVYWTLCVLLSSSLLFSSCGDDNNESETSKYASASASDVKKMLQEDAISFVSELEGLQNEQAYKTLEVFAKLVDIDSPELPNGSSITSGNAIITINSFDGKFTWERNSWKYTEQTGKLSFHFPSTVNGTNNTEEIAVTGESSDKTVTFEEYDSYPVYNPETGYNNWVDDITEHTVRLPKTLQADIISGSNKVGNISVNSTYPDGASVSFNYGGYNLEANAGVGNTNNATATLKKGSLVLLSANANAKGNIDLEDENADVQNVDMSFVMMDKLVLEMSQKNVSDEEDRQDAIYEKYWDYNYYEMYNNVNGYAKAREIELVEFRNESYSYVLKAADGTFIANMVAEVKAGRPYSESGYYDYKKGEYVETPWTSQDWGTISILKFEDGTSHDADVYFGEGFETLINKVEALMNVFE